MGSRAFAVGNGKQGALVSGDVEEGVDQEVSDPLAQGGCLDKGGRTDGLGGAQGARQQHLLVPVHSQEVLLYSGMVLEDKGGGRCGRPASW